MKKIAVFMAASALLILPACRKKDERKSEPTPDAQSEPKVQPKPKDVKTVSLTDLVAYLKTADNKRNKAKQSNNELLVAKVAKELDQDQRATFPNGTIVIGAVTIEQIDKKGNIIVFYDLTDKVGEDGFVGSVLRQQARRCMCRSSDVKWLESLRAGLKVDVVGELKWFDKEPSPQPVMKGTFPYGPVAMFQINNLHGK